MKRLLKDGFFLVYLELGLEVGRVVGDAAAVGAATTLGESKALIGELITDTTPIAFTASVLLHLFGIDVGIAVLAEEAGDMNLGDSRAIRNPLVVPVIGLVRTSHGWCS